jgi:pantoate--beta-alanine ligase
MYPLSLLKDPEAGGELGERMLQDTSKQRGAFVEVKGWGNVMEGKSRRKCCGQREVAQILTICYLASAQFFQGVATVCTKLFNAVEVSLPRRSLFV